MENNEKRAKGGCLCLFVCSAVRPVCVPLCLFVSVSSSVRLCVQSVCLFVYLSVSLRLFGHCVKDGGSCDTENIIYGLGCKLWESSQQLRGRLNGHRAATEQLEEENSHMNETGAAEHFVKVAHDLVGESGSRSRRGRNKFATPAGLNTTAGIIGQF